jgi:hypothetical protein
VRLAALAAKELDCVEVPLGLEREGAADPAIDELQALGVFRERHRIGLATSTWV